MKSESFQSFSQGGFLSSQERELSENQSHEASFEERAEKLREYTRNRLKREDKFLKFVSQISQKFGTSIPEQMCKEILESAEGQKFFTEEPMVRAALLEYQKLKQG